MARQKNDYFKLIEEQVACCVKAANYLEQVAHEFDPAKIGAQRDEMHLIEHEADKIHHDILMRLSTEFITPIDQADIVQLIQIVDDITDAIDEVVMDLYMFHVKELPQQALALSQVVNRCVTTLLEAVKELKNFKKPEKLHALLIKVNDIETEGDKIYMNALHELFGLPDIDGKTLLGGKLIYDSLEHCCDLCEHATDLLEQVIIKNT